MTEYEIVQLYIDVATKQDAIWAIFFSVHLALFGGIIYVDRPLRRGEKCFAVLGYLIFAILNFSTVRGGQKILENLLSDAALIKASAASSGKTIGHLDYLLNSSDFLYREPVTIGIHVIVAAFAIGAIIFDRPRRLQTN
jgi:hypothetical protein